MARDQLPKPVPHAGGVAWRVARALGGALLRVGRSLPDYLTSGRADREDRADRARSVGAGADEDTGEWPAP